MVISHKHKYIFIELPQTASTAISHELTDQYEGERILYKHALYDKFLKTASSAEKEYFAFSGIRNPMEVVVSKYNKFITNHHDYESGMKHYKHGKMEKLTARKREIYQFKWIKKRNASFATYFKHFYIFPYSNWSIVDHHKLGYVMHFENIQDEFSTVINKLGIGLKRPLPIKNKTVKEKNAWENYFDTPELKQRARYIFGPFMRRWGFEFPESWSNTKEPWYAEPLYGLVNIPRVIYWKYLK